MREVRDPIIVALDLDERESLLRVAGILRGKVETVKVGLEAYTSMGPRILDELREMGLRVFADLKLHDIPNTVSGTVKSLVRRGACMLTVHISGGREMLEAAVESALEESEALGVEPPLVLGVTVLTSLDDADLAGMGWRGDVRAVVMSLGAMALSCGVGGLVASAREAEALRKAHGPEPVIVTPGIRLQGAEAHDQARTATPAEALSAGADYLVVGRPVIAQADPAAALNVVRMAAGLPERG